MTHKPRPVLRSRLSMEVSPLALPSACHRPPVACVSAPTARAKTKQHLRASLGACAATSLPATTIGACSRHQPSALPFAFVPPPPHNHCALRAGTPSKMGTPPRCRQTPSRELRVHALCSSYAVALAPPSSFSANARLRPGSTPPRCFSCKYSMKTFVFL